MPHLVRNLKIGLEQQISSLNAIQSANEQYELLLMAHLSGSLSARIEKIEINKIWDDPGRSADSQTSPDFLPRMQGWGYDPGGQLDRQVLHGQKQPDIG